MSSTKGVPTTSKAAAEQNAISEIMTKFTVDVPTAGCALRIGRNASYKAREAGDIPSIKVGGQWRVPTAPLRRMLGLEEAPAEAIAARGEHERRSDAHRLSMEATAA